MRQITGITSDAKQAMTLILPDGSTVPFNLEYLDGQQGWFMSLSYNTFALNTYRITVGANMLRKFRSILPFGIGCMTRDIYEDIFITDFATGRASLFLLDSDDIQKFEGILNVN